MIRGSNSGKEKIHNFSDISRPVRWLKGKVHPITEGLDGVGGQRSPPRQRDLLPIEYDAGWHQGRSGRAQRIFPPPGLEPRAFQPVASRYTDWAILAHRR